MGRPTKLTSEVQKRICDALSVGATHRLACEYGGISHETLYTWLHKGTDGKAPYVEFVDAFTRAQGTAAVGWLAKIEQAASAGDWRAAAWKLEKRYAEGYGKQRQDVTHSFKGPLQVILMQYGDSLDPV
jgi:transposase